MARHNSPPYDAGDKNNLPQEIRDIANLRSEVIAWTKLDEEYERSLVRTMFCHTAAPMIVMPCFWPHLILLSPCLLGSACIRANAAKAQYWILTETELKIVTQDYNTCCCPGIARSGNIIKSIPLENITDATVDQKGEGVANKCIGAYSFIYVDTASSGPRHHEAIGFGLKHPEWFIREVLDRRDIVKGAPQAAVMGAPVMGAPQADTMAHPGAGDGGDVTSRINKLTELRDQGLVTPEEFEKKRKEIISSL